MRTLKASLGVLALLVSPELSVAATPEELAYANAKRIIEQAPAPESMEGELARRYLISRTSRLAVMSLASAPTRDDAAIAALNSEIDKNDASDIEYIRPLVYSADAWLNGRFNPQTVNTIWLIVQHSKDLVLQERVLEQIEPFVKRGMLDGQDYALLFDRVAVGRGRPQLYGTQLICFQGAFVPSPIKEEEDIDARREAMGLGISLKEYVGLFSKMSC